MLYALILADGDPPKDDAAGQGQPPGGLFSSPLFPLMILFAAAYFLLLRPQARRREMERQQLIDSLQKDDEVLTHAGIYGNVVTVNDDKVVLKIDDKVRIKMAKSSIARNITAEERLKQQTPTKDGASNTSASSDSTGIKKA